MKGSGCVRVTASGACATIGSLKTIREPGERCFSICCNAHDVRGEDVQTDHVFDGLFDGHGICGDAKLCQGQWG